jgi:hypothetical protein
MRGNAVRWIGLMALVGSLSCGEKENPMGQGLVDTGLASEADHQVRCTIMEATSFQYVCPSAEDECQRGPGGTGTLLVGSGYGYRAEVGLSFEGIGTDATQVDSARLHLTQAPWATDRPDSVTVHLLTAAFEEADVVFGHGLDSVGYEITPLPGAVVWEDSGLSIDVTQVVRAWYEAGTMGGVGIRAHVPALAEPSFALFHSSETSAPPYLSIHLHTEGDSASDPVLYIPTHDVHFLVRDPAAEPLSAVADRITVGKGFASRSLLKADVSEIPVDATINRARLILRVDPDQSVYDSLEVGAHLVSGVWDSSRTLSAELSSGTGWVIPGVDSAEIETTRLVQLWTAELVQNDGFLLKPVGEVEGIDFVRFLWPQIPNSVGSPVLVVEYSVPPPEWYRQ